MSNKQILNVSPTAYPQTQLPVQIAQQDDDNNNPNDYENHAGEINQNGQEHDEKYEIDQQSTPPPPPVARIKNNEQQLKKVEYLQNYLQDQYEDKIKSLRSSSPEQNNNQAHQSASNLASSSSRYPQTQIISSELQKILSPQEIRELAICLTSKSVGDVHAKCSNLSSNGSRISRTSRKDQLSQEQNEWRQYKNSQFDQAQVSSYGQSRQASLNASYNQYIRASNQSSQYQQKSRSLSANRAQLRLYEYGVIKRERSQLLEKLIVKQAQGEANQRKISKRSYQLLTQQMENRLNAAFDSVDHMQKKHLSFEQVGRVLSLLGIFHHLFYDENCHLVPQNSAASLKQMDTKRKFTEMYLHEELWRICSGNQQDQENVPIGIIYCMLRILMDPVQLSLSATVGLMEEYLAKQQDSSQLNPPEINIQEQLQKLVSSWRELHTDQFAYRSIGYLKARQVEELKATQSQTLTFHPKIEVTSEIIELHNTANFLQKYQVDGQLSERYEQKQRELEEEYRMNAGFDNQLGTPQESQFNSPSRIHSVDRYKILYKKQEILDEKMQLLRQEKELLENQNCPFKPDLRLNSKINECSMLSKYNGYVNIFERLYQPENRQERIQRDEYVQTQKVIESLSECTFKPNVNRMRQSGINERMDAKDLVHDFEKTVGRVKTGYEKAQILKSKLEFISVGDKYSTIKKQKQNPPSLLSRTISRKKPFTQLQVSIGKNKIVTISLREDDDPKVFARNFAKTHQISPAMEANLQNIIADFIKQNAEKNS